MQQRIMRRTLAAGFLAAAVAAVSLVGLNSHGRAAPPQPADAAAAPAADQSANVPVKVVALFSSGVGYFEHEGVVKGGSSTVLQFKTQQINDILKSLLLESSSGTVGTVDYPSQDPIDKILHSFQVDITGNPPLAKLLEQLRGAKVTVTIGAEKLEGTILGLEQRPKAVGDKGSIEVWVLNLLTDGTIRSIELRDVQGLHLDDPQLQQELDKALTALAQARDQDKKPVTIHFTGEGEREVRIGYIVETPVWKTSYRLFLTENPAAATQPSGQPSTQPAYRDGKLQGWAIVENQTDNDWHNVQLSLISGRPISFIQNLYTPMYIPRPVVQPQLYASLTPQTYGAGMGRELRRADYANADQIGASANGTLAAAPMAGPYGGGGGGGGGQMMQQGQNGPQEEAAMDATKSVASLASATKMGELFEYTVGNVSLARQRSAMIPIITDNIDVEKVSIYNASVLPRNPLNGARIKNTTGKHLLGGPITVLDANRYAGDAEIDDVPPGQERLISYGVDLNILMDATHNHTSDSVLSGKIVKGVLQVQHKWIQAQDYKADNKGDKDRTLIIEHPRSEGWTLVDTLKPIETTDSVYRFRGHVPAHTQTTLTVKEQKVDWEAFEILPMDLSAIDIYERTGEIPKTVKDALAKAAALKSAIIDTQRQIEENQKETSRINSEQDRIRQNMKVVNDHASAYYNRLLTKLNDQETQLDKLQSGTDDLQKKLDQQTKDLDNYLQNLNVG